MVRKILMLMAIVLVFSALQVKGEVIHSTWVGEDGGWGDASNWDPAIVPDNNASQTFVVTIDGGTGDKKSVALIQSRTIDQLDCYGNVWLVSDTPNDLVLIMAEPNGFSNHGNIRVMGRFDDAHHFKICGSVTNEQEATLQLHRTTIEGPFYNVRGATAVVNYANDFSNGAWNDGFIVIYPIGEMDVDANVINTGQIQVLGGTCAATESLLNDVNGVINGFGVVHSNELFENSGKIYASGGSLLLHSDSCITNTGTLASKGGTSLNIVIGLRQPNEASVPDVNNQGTIEINSAGAVTFNSYLRNEPNGIIKLHGGILEATTITQADDANFAGFGGITGDVFIDPNGIIEITGPTNIVGNVTIDPNATLEISDGTTLITGHTTCNNGTIHMIGGRVICQGGLTNNSCNIIWEPGTYTNMADFNLDGTVNFKDYAYFGDTWLWQADWYAL